jgi:hypothetical protein
LLDRDGHHNTVPYTSRGITVKRTAAPSPDEDGDLGAKLDRIIELLEQQRTTVIYQSPYWHLPYPSTPWVVTSGTSTWTGPPTYTVNG